MALSVGDKVILLQGNDKKLIAYPVTTDIATGNNVILGETYDRKLVALNVCSPEVNKNGFNVLTHDKKLAIVQTCEKGCYWLLYENSECDTIIRNVCYMKQKDSSGNTIKSSRIIQDNQVSYSVDCFDESPQLFGCSDDQLLYLIEQGVCNNGCGLYSTFCHGNPKCGIYYNNSANWTAPSNYQRSVANYYFYGGEIGGRFIQATTPIGPYCGTGLGFNGIYTAARYVTTNSNDYQVKHVFHTNNTYFYWNITYDVDIFNNEIIAININSDFFMSSSNINVFSNTANYSFSTSSASKGCLWVYNGTIYAGNDYGIWQSTNGTSWTQLSTLSCNCIQNYNGDIYFGVDSSNGIGIYKLNGTTLQQITTDDGLYGNNCSKMTLLQDYLIIVVDNFVYYYDGDIIKPFCYSRQLQQRINYFGASMGTILDVIGIDTKLYMLFYDVIEDNSIYYNCQLILSEEYVLGMNG